MQAGTPSGAARTPRARARIGPRGAGQDPELRVHREADASPWEGSQMSAAQRYPRGSNVPNERIIEQVHGILARAEIRFALSEDRRTYLVPVPGGSAAVLIDFHAWGRAQTMISLRSEVLVELE